MNKTVYTVLSILVIASISFAHRVLIMIDDNADGTIYVETGLSSGGSAAGATYYITESSTGRPLAKGTIPEEGYFTTTRPDAAYSVSVDMGQGHIVTQKGPELLPITSKDETTVKDSTISESDSTISK